MKKVPETSAKFTGAISGSVLAVYVVVFGLLGKSKPIVVE